MNEVFENRISLPKLLFRDACPELFKVLCDHFGLLKRPELIEQLKNLVIPPQALFGNRESFRFIVDRIPVLTADDTSSLQFRDWENIDLETLGGYVDVQLDNFGRIELFYLSKLSRFFDSLLSYEGYIGAPFAEHFPLVR